MKYIPLVFFILSVIVSAQESDSLKNKFNINDTLKTSLKDSTAASDSLLTKKFITPRDTLKPIFEKPLDNNSYFINKELLTTFYDYRYTADFLRSFPVNFIKDQGFIGQPNEAFVYGIGNGGISYFQDGVFYNNHFQNSLDLHTIESEYVDSVEIIPSPRGFLYGPVNNPASINFITKNLITRQPYTRIKFLQGPNGETMLDGLFNSSVYKKIKLSFDINSKNFDSSFTNSGYSLWQGRVRLNYFLSDHFNLTGGYDYAQTETGLNGGINIDSISKTTSNINSILYDPVFAPVYFGSRTMKNKIHLFNLKLLSRPSAAAPGELSLYYRFNLEEIFGGEYYFSQDKEKSLGLLFRQKYSKDIFSAELLADYENTKLQYLSYDRSQKVNEDRNNFAASAILSLNLIDSSLIPSVFYKFSSDSYLNKTFNGIGFDLTYLFKEYLSLYAGYSTYQNYTGKNNNVSNAELGMDVNYCNLRLRLKLFKRNNFYIYKDPNPFTTNDEYIINGNSSGFGAYLNYYYWKILLEGSGSYNFAGKTNSDYSKSVTPLIPKINFNGGIFYKDILFNQNLNLKTGFMFFFTGKQEMKVNGLIAQTVDQSIKVDFTLIGEIQKVAYVYFTWENLFDSQYYIVPYYPMPSRGIRFGISWELLD